MLLALALLASGAEPAVAAEPAPQPSARAWILIDARDGEVLDAHKATSSYPIASTTKLMTALVARRELELGETVIAPAYEALAAESLLGLEEGERIEVRDLLYGLLLVSGNDAAAALAQASAGSQDAFVAQMNRTAARLGLGDTSFTNPIGLDEEGNFSSASDLATLAARLERDPLFRRIFDTPTTTIESGSMPRTLVNRNVLVRTVPYVTGVKTGYTLGAANVLVGSAEKDGIELVSAVLGAPTESDRDAGTLALFDYGFSLYDRRKPVRKGEPLAEVAIRNRGLAVDLAASENLTVTVRRGQRVEVSIDAPREADGPIVEGERIGEAVVAVDGEQVGTVPLAATRSAAAASLVERYDAAVPGPRALAWVLAFVSLAVVLVGAMALWDRRR